MNYKESVDSYRKVYKRISNIGMTDGEILSFISEAQQHLQKKYGYIIKNSRNNSTAQTNCIVGTDTYTIGTGATNLPNDIDSIYQINLNDTLKTEIKSTGQNNFINITKTTSKPYFYALYGQGTRMTLELDTLPDVAYEMTIRYIMKMELFTGSGTDTTWGDYDKSASDWGGSLKLEGWENLIIQGALAKVIDPLNAKGLLRIWEQDSDTFYQSIALQNSSGNIPAYEGISNVPLSIIRGDDPPRP